MPLSYIHRVGKAELTGETVGQRLKASVDRVGDRIAVISPDQDYRVTYSEFDRETSDVAKALIARGVQRGDRVGIWSPNRFEWIVVQFAVARIGAILVNVNTALRTEDLAFVLARSEIKVLLYAKGFRATNYVEILGTVRGSLDHLESEVLLDRDWESLKIEGRDISDDELSEREASVQSDDLWNMQFTSGTTGMPKPVVLSHHAVLNNALSIAYGLGYTEEDRLCNPMPFHHSFGLACGNIACLSTGASVVIPGEYFDPHKVLQIVQDERCTALYGVPTMFIAELGIQDAEQFDLSSLRVGVMGGAPCPVEVMKQLESKMNIRNVLVIFGQTEGAGLLTMTRSADSIAQRTETVGTVIDNMELKIVDPDTRVTVPHGVVGEICTRGYSRMSEYWKDPEATALAVDKSGWLHTGDLGEMDSDGYVAVMGRLKDMIIRGGQNVYPREVEEYLHHHPEVDDVYVVGVASERYGEEVAACIRLRPGSTLGRGELEEYCTGKIATYKIPKYWWFVESFPQTATGKVRKFKIREAIEKSTASAGDDAASPVLVFDEL